MVVDADLFAVLGVGVLTTISFIIDNCHLLWYHTQQIDCSGDRHLLATDSEWKVGRFLGVKLSIDDAYDERG